MDPDDKELYESATSDDAPAVIEQEAPAEQPEGQPRDEHGRFATRSQSEPAPQAEPPQPAPQGRDEAHVPSWRLREERERAESAERRAREIEANFQRQFQELQSRLPKSEPQPAPDVFEDPNKFLEYGVRQHVDPINSRVANVVETISKKWAIKEHGQEKVDAAYNWLAQGVQTRNPEAVAVYQRAMSSDDPYEEIIGAHRKQTVYQQIGNDPNAWFEKELERRMADPQFSAAQLQKIHQVTRANPQSTTVQLPPSLNRATSAAPPSADGEDDSEAGLLKSALRR